MRTRAFTLIELLIVVLTIALLLAVLAPGLARARLHAQRTRCATNLRGIGTVLIQYVHDYQQAPSWPDYATVAELGAWYGLPPGVLRCPGDRLWVDDPRRPGRSSYEGDGQIRALLRHAMRRGCPEVSPNDGRVVVKCSAGGHRHGVDVEGIVRTW